MNYNIIKKKKKKKKKNNIIFIYIFFFFFFFFFLLFFKNLFTKGVEWGGEVSLFFFFFFFFFFFLYLYFVSQFTLQTERSWHIKIGNQPLSMALGRVQIQIDDYMMLIVNNNS